MNAQTQIKTELEPINAELFDILTRDLEDGAHIMNANMDVLGERFSAIINQTFAVDVLKIEIGAELYWIMEVHVSEFAYYNLSCCAELSTHDLRFFIVPSYADAVARIAHAAMHTPSD